MVGLSILSKGVALILGVNVLVVLWCGLVTLRFRRRKSKHPGVRCSRCGDWDAKYFMKDVQGKFCKECWYELAEGLMFGFPKPERATPESFNHSEPGPTSQSASERK